jgi:hypothetical protein
LKETLSTFWPEGQEEAPAPPDEVLDLLDAVGGQALHVRQDDEVVAVEPLRVEELHGLDVDGEEDAPLAGVEREDEGEGLAVLGIVLRLAVDDEGAQGALHVDCEVTRVVHVEVVRIDRPPSRWRRRLGEVVLEGDLGGRVGRKARSARS